jgi:hypothetical protein
MNDAEKNLASRLQQIQRLVGDTVVVKIGIMNNSKVDIISIQNQFSNKDKTETSQEESNDSQARLTYIG